MTHLYTNKIRCAECDCKNGGAECTWIKRPKIATANANWETALRSTEAWKARAEAAEARALEMEGSAQAALAGYEAEREARQKAEAEREAALGALLEIDALDPESKVDGCSHAALRGLVLRMGEIARDARQKGGE